MAIEPKNGEKEIILDEPIPRPAPSIVPFSFFSSTFSPLALNSLGQSLYKSVRVGWMNRANSKQIQSQEILNSQQGKDGTFSGAGSSAVIAVPSFGSPNIILRSLAQVTHTSSQVSMLLPFLNAHHEVADYVEMGFGEKTMWKIGGKNAAQSLLHKFVAIANEISSQNPGNSLLLRIALFWELVEVLWGDRFRASLSPLFTSGSSGSAKYADSICRRKAFEVWLKRVASCSPRNLHSSSAEARIVEQALEELICGNILNTTRLLVSAGYPHLAAIVAATSEGNSLRRSDICEHLLSVENLTTDTGGKGKQERIGSPKRLRSILKKKSKYDESDASEEKILEKAPESEKEKEGEKSDKVNDLQNSEANEIVNKILLIIAGKIEDKSVVESLDWIRCLSLHLRFEGSPNDTIEEVFLRFHSSIQNGSSPTPSPLSFGSCERSDDVSNDSTVLDSLFQALLLFTTQTIQLNKAFKPESFSLSFMDVQQSWYAITLFKSLGFPSPSNYIEITKSFMLQLEESGNWKWAIYVALLLDLV